MRTPTVYQEADLPIAIKRQRDYYAYRVGWDAAANKFTVEEKSGYGTPHAFVSDYGPYDTFAEAYARAEKTASTLAMIRDDIFILDKNENMRALIGMPTMSKEQFEELLDALPEYERVQNSDKDRCKSPLKDTISDAESRKSSATQKEPDHSPNQKRDFEQQDR